MTITLPKAYCETVHELLMCKLRKKTKRFPKYDQGYIAPVLVNKKKRITYFMVPATKRKSVKVLVGKFIPLVTSRKMPKEKIYQNASWN